MARCRATTPCEFYDDVHDFGCPERGVGIADPELRELYATETADERDVLDHLLTLLIDRDLLDTDGYTDAGPGDVTGGEPEWLALRKAVRAYPADLLPVLDRVEVFWETRDHFAPVPALRVRPTCALCGTVLEPRPDHPGAELGDWYIHPRADHESLPGHTDSRFIPHATL